MDIAVRNNCSDYQSYRAQRVKSLFNVEAGCNFDRDFRLGIEAPELEGWSVGIVVGPSGSGKTSIGRALQDQGWKLWDPRWPADRPIVDAIQPKGDFDSVTGALAQVGLGDVPAWLRPYAVLSNGEKFRANLARAIVEAPDRIVIDEFTSVVDRQIARIGAMAFTKGWRRRESGQVVVLTCHYDVAEWMDPDWIFDTVTGEFALARGCLQRPSIELAVYETKWAYWDLFKPHHYLVDAGPMAFSTAYVGFVGDEPVAHLGMSGKVSGKGRREARACRMVVMPEWQGAGIGMRFLNTMCERELRGEGFIGRPANTQFHTAHPALVAALKRDPKWRQLSAHLHGGRKATGSGWGGHFRGVTGWRFYGDPGA